MELEVLKSMLNDHIEQLALLRKELAAMREELAARKAELEPYEEAVRAKARDVAEIEDNVRKVAVEIYNLTGNRAVHSFVSVRVERRLEYSEDEAVEWCRQHLPTALKLDNRAFEKVALAAELGFVKVWQEPKALIATKLGSEE